MYGISTDTMSIGFISTVRHQSSETSSYGILRWQMDKCVHHIYNNELVWGIRFDRQDMCVRAISGSYFTEPTRIRGFFSPYYCDFLERWVI